MPEITISKSAIDNLIKDPKLRRWRECGTAEGQPCLSYYRRYYSTAPDGTVTEHGDGFMLSTIDLEDPRQTKGQLIRRVPLQDGFDILVAADESVVSGDFTIGLTPRRGLTYEPRSSS